MAKRRASTFEDALKAVTSTTSNVKKQTSNTANRAELVVEAPTDNAPEPKTRRKWDENKCSLYLPHPAVYKALLDLQHAESNVRRKKLNDYFLEGIDRVFADRGLPSIEELIKKAGE